MIKKLSLYTFFMLLIPLIVWAIGWHWTGDHHLSQSVDNFLYWLTETGSVPYGLITCVVFMFWLIGLTRRRYSWLLVCTICVISVIGTQVIKRTAKTVFAEPRPYIEQIMGDKTEQFYALPHEQREHLIAEHYKKSEFPLIANHRIHEIDYSFPSGHTIFSVSWMLLFAGLLLGMRGQAVIFAQFFTIAWSALMLISRVRLGMHFPIDLFVSTLVAWAFHIVLFTWIFPYLATRRLFKKRG